MSYKWNILQWMRQKASAVELLIFNPTGNFSKSECQLTRQKFCLKADLNNMGNWIHVRTMPICFSITLFFSNGRSPGAQNGWFPSAQSFATSAKLASNELHVAVCRIPEGVNRPEMRDGGFGAQLLSGRRRCWLFSRFLASHALSGAKQMCAIPQRPINLKL